jgi:nucleoid DNA-binding protein
MNYSGLYKKVAQTTGKPQDEVKQVVQATMEAITESLARGEAVRFSGFGSFTIKDVNERIHFNPRSKERTTIPAKRKVKFKSYRGLKDVVDSDGT